MEIKQQEQKERGSGKWNNNTNSEYSITKVDGNKLSDYYISKKSYKGKFDTKDVLTSIKNGEERFYVMALENLDSNTHTWYGSKYGSLSEDNNEANTVKELGKGKENTKKMKDIWNEDADTSKSENDVWKVIQDAGVDLDKWYVPSRAEWAAFGDFCYTKLDPKMDTSNFYTSRSLSGWYWSSSQENSYYAWHADFDDGFTEILNVSSGECIRMGATF